MQDLFLHHHQSTILILTGAEPGKQEDKEGVGFIGNAGKDVLWPELIKHDITRDMFHLTNICKCYPRFQRKSLPVNIEACRDFLEEEIEMVKPFMILALGSTPMYFFTGQDKGIMQRNATIEWFDDYGCYVVFCIHPASTLHSPKNKSEFARGIKFFQ